MAETDKKTYRLARVASKLNTGWETIAENLLDNGYEVSKNPNAKITEEMHKHLMAEFSTDLAIKKKSEQITIGVRKEEEPVVPPPVTKPVEEGSNFRELTETILNQTADGKEPIPTIELQGGKKDADAVEIETPLSADELAAVGPMPATEAPKETPVTPEVKAEAPAAEPTKEPEPEIKAPPVEEKNEPVPPVAKEEPAPEAKPEVPIAEVKKPEVEQPPAPKVEKPAAKEETKQPAKPDKVEKPAAKKSLPEKKKTKESHAKPAAKQKDKQKEAKPAAEAKPKDQKPTRQPSAIDPIPAADDKLHVREKVTLEGVKVVGKIELPVEPTKKEKEKKKEEERKRRKRKKIPNKAGRSATPGGRPLGGGQSRSGSGRGQGKGKQGGRKGTPKPELSEKEIQDKIKATMAKLSGQGSGKGQKARYKKLKKEKAAAREALETGDEKLQLTEFISVSELASILDVSVTEVISKCMSLGVIVSINQRLDAEVIELVASEYGNEVEFINVTEVEEVLEEEDNPEAMESRAPIVTIMGHVDHGKTSLLDHIRKANVVAGEVGGITQHIGAYEVTTDSGKAITFLDTPGHEAFTAMRARGAKLTDVAVIVIAADDNVMPQTKEAISHAQAAGVPIVFAINKIDKPNANPDIVKKELSDMNILVEDWGGDYQCQEISAKTGLNIDELLDKILLQAEMLELEADAGKRAVGTVVEAALDKGRGYVATVLVTAGTLKVGENLVCGQYSGKVKAMFNERGGNVIDAGPATPVLILGLNGAPQAGEKFYVMETEQEAKSIANKREQIMREQGLRTMKHITLDEIGRRLALGNFKELNLIVKGDFDGSVEALSDSLLNLSTEEVAVKIIHRSVGQIKESDVLLATASDAVIMGFNVRPSLSARKLAEKENIEIRTYSIIYDAIEEIKLAMEGMLEPTIEEKIVCNVEIRDIFKNSKFGTIGGCYVVDGKITRNTKIRLLRDGIIIHTGELASLKRFKDDVKEVLHNFECGVSLKNYNDIKVGDVIEGFEEVEIKRTL